MNTHYRQSARNGDMLTHTEEGPSCTASRAAGMSAQRLHWWMDTGFTILTGYHTLQYSFLFRLSARRLQKMHLQRTAAPHYTTWGIFPSFSAPQLALGSGGRRWVAALAAYSPRALLSFPFCTQSTVLWPPPHNRRLEKQVTAWRCNLRCQRGSHSRLIGEPKTLFCCWGEENTKDPKNHMAPKGQQKSQSYTRQKLASASHGFGTYLSIQHEDSSTRMFSLMCSGHCFHTLAMYNKWKQ